MLKKLKLKYSSKVKYVIGLIKIEEKHNHFLIEKIIGAVEKNTLHAISMEKTPEIMLEIEKNYRLFRRVYQSLLGDIEDAFVQYIHLLEPNDIKQRMGVESIVSIQSCFELFNFTYFSNVLLS